MTVIVWDQKKRWEHAMRWINDVLGLKPDVLERKYQAVLQTRIVAPVEELYPVVPLDYVGDPGADAVQRITIHHKFKGETRESSFLAPWDIKYIIVQYDSRRPDRIATSTSVEHVIVRQAKTCPLLLDLDMRRVPDAFRPCCDSWSRCINAPSHRLETETRTTTHYVEERHLGMLPVTPPMGNTPEELRDYHALRDVQIRFLQRTVSFQDEFLRAATRHAEKCGVADAL